MTNEEKYFTYKDALLASVILCIAFIIQLAVFERLEDKVKNLETKIHAHESRNPQSH